jgi:hypothetical protein
MGLRPTPGVFPSAPRALALDVLNRLERSAA